MNRILNCAQAIASMRRSRTPLKTLPAWSAPRDEAEGYLVQRALHDLLLPQTGALVGYKIGCTSKVMQEYLDIPHPCGGGVFERGVHDSGVRLNTADFVRVGVECEIAAIEAYMPAIEVVDDRYEQWETLGAPTLIADDFFAACCVLGAPRARNAVPNLLS